MFAVNKSYQDCTYHSEEFGDRLYSDIILGMVIGDIYSYSTGVLGAQIILLYSTNEAVKFYIRNGFSDLGKYTALYSEYTEDCTPMYLRLFE